MDKLQEEALQYYKKAIVLLPGNVYCKKSANSKYLWCNNNFAKILHLKKPEDIAGKTDYDFLEKELADAVVKNDRDIVEKKMSSSYEEKGVNNAGEEAIYLTTKTPIYDDEHNVVALLGISIDITEIKKIEEELRIAKERAELASEIKSQFIQNMEHDLRTPASGVSGMLNLLLETYNIEPELKDKLQKTAKASQRLLDFLNDIISFDKYSTGQLPLTSLEFDLHDMLHSIIEMETPTIHDKGIELKLDIANDVPQHIISDKHRIFRILLNLAGNAVKFTKNGYVKISLSIKKHIDPRHCLLKIVVEDTGIGIPADKIHRIYERFERCIPSNRGLYPGAGLGLSITKQFIDELQGDVSVESKEGEGTTFTCIIPCRIPLADMTNYESIFNTLSPSTQHETTQEFKGTVAADKPEPKIEKPQAVIIPQKKNKVLLVEDDPMAQILATGILNEILHFEYDLAQTGKEALELWSKNKYDFILMDLGLPDIKGDEVTKQIREKDKNTIIIALTAHDEDRVKNLCKKAGMQGFMTKPISSDKVLTTLKEIQNTEAKATEEAPLAEPAVAINEKQIFDIALCRKNAHNDDNLVKKLLDVFVKKLPEYLAEFKGYYDEKNIEYLGLLAHKLKGAAVIAGASRLAGATEDLQHIAVVEKITIKDVEEYYNKVCAEIMDVSRVLKKIGY